jgi:hypothetical protein
MRIQAFRSELPVEGLDKGIVGRLAGREKSSVTSR